MRLLINQLRNRRNDNGEFHDISAQTLSIHG